MTSKSKVRGIVELFGKIRQTGVEMIGRVGIAAKDTWMVLALGLRTNKTGSITGADSNPRRRELTLSGSGAVQR